MNVVKALLIVLTVILRFITQAAAELGNRAVTVLREVERKLRTSMWLFLALATLRASAVELSPTEDTPDIYKIPGTQAASINAVISPTLEGESMADFPAIIEAQLKKHDYRVDFVLLQPQGTMCPGEVVARFSRCGMSFIRRYFRQDGWDVVLTASYYSVRKDDDGRKAHIELLIATVKLPKRITTTKGK